MTKNKFLIAEYIDSNRANITAKCNEGMVVSAIAKLYNVSTSVLYLRLIKWGVTIKKSHNKAKRRTVEMPRVHYKRKFSKAFLARQKENTRVNNAKIKYIDVDHSTRDEKVVDFILNMAFR